MDGHRPHRDARALLTNRRLTDEATVDHIQDLVIDLELLDAVPASVREHFDALRELHVYGVFQPEFFAMTVTRASLTLEYALGTRFIEAHGGLVAGWRPMLRRRCPHGS